MHLMNSNNKVTFIVFLAVIPEIKQHVGACRNDTTSSSGDLQATSIILLLHKTHLLDD